VTRTSPKKTEFRAVSTLSQNSLGPKLCLGPLLSRSSASCMASGGPGYLVRAAQQLEAAQSVQPTGTPTWRRSWSARPGQGQSVVRTTPFATGFNSVRGWHSSCHRCKPVVSVQRGARHKNSCSPVPSRERGEGGALIDSMERRPLSQDDPSPPTPLPQGERGENLRPVRVPLADSTRLSSILRLGSTELAEVRPEGSSSKSNGKRSAAARGAN
jgi:hypothetical protein